MADKTLLVTGASRGIGRACALLGAKNGWAVGVNYREDAKSADAVVEAIAKSGGRAVALKGDVAVEADAVGIDAAARALGPLTAVIANAGIIAPTAKLADMSAERMRHVFEVNAPYSLLWPSSPGYCQPIQHVTQPLWRVDQRRTSRRTQSGRTGSRR